MFVAFEAAKSFPVKQWHRRKKTKIAISISWTGKMKVKIPLFHVFSPSNQSHKYARIN